MKENWLKNTLPSRIETKFQRNRNQCEETPLNSFKIRPVLSELEDERSRIVPSLASPKTPGLDYSPIFSSSREKEQIELKTYKLKNQLTFIRARQEKNRKAFSEFPMNRNMGEVVNQNEQTLKSLMTRNQRQIGDHLDKGIRESFEKNRLLVMAKRGVNNKEDAKGKVFFPYMRDDPKSFAEKYKRMVEKALLTSYEGQNDYRCKYNTLKIEGDLTSSFQKQHSTPTIPTLALTQSIETVGSSLGGDEFLTLDSGKSANEGFRDLESLKRIFEKYTKTLTTLPEVDHKKKKAAKKLKKGSKVPFGEDLLSTNWHVSKNKDSLGRSLIGFKRSNKSQTFEGFYKPNSLTHISSFDHFEKMGAQITEKNIRSISYYEQREKEISKFNPTVGCENQEKGIRFFRKSLVK